MMPSPIEAADLEAFELVRDLDPVSFAINRLGADPFSYQRMLLKEVGEACWRGGGRFIVNAPSRHGKSWPLSMWLPVWFLHIWPEKWVMLGCYGQNLATKWGRDVRNLINRVEGHRGELADDAQAAHQWRTKAGGGMIAVGRDGPALGFGGHLMIVDDPHKDWAEAHSPVERDKTIEWFLSTFWSRQEPGATIAIPQQRMHPEDLSGYLLKEFPGKWRQFCFPAIAEENDVLGRKVGEALCPSRYPTEALLELKSGMDQAAWDAMFQQHPERNSPGNLYGRYDESIHVRADVRLRDDLPLQVDFDFNRNPGMHVEIGQYDPMADLFIVRHEIHGPYMKLDTALAETTKLLKAVYGKWRWPRLQVFGDATGRQERAETTRTAYQQVDQWHRDLQAEFGCQIVFETCVPASNPPVRTRIDTFNAALRDNAGDVHFSCHPDCKRLIADLRDMREDEQGLEDKRDTKLSHASSAVGYRICRLRPIDQPWKHYSPPKQEDRYILPTRKIDEMMAGYKPLSTAGRFKTAF